jgi:Tfp pilus assembly protein PilO
MSDRDRKLLMGLIPVVVLAVFWFLLFSPKREEAAKAKSDLAAQEQRLNDAKAVVAQANTSKTNFAADYGEIVRLGKAIPAQVDMPSLLLQLDGAARGTGIAFTKITAGPRESAVLATPSTTTGTDSSSSSDSTSSASSSSSSSSAPPVAAGGQQAASAPGGATEAANNAAATGNQQAAAASASGVSSSDTQTSTSSRQGGLPIGGGSTATGPTAAAAPAGLDTVPLELEFNGDFFHLANFFHQVKRFVHVVNNNVVVNGRLITVQSVNYTSSADLFPRIKAQLTATVYLTPKAEGVTAGATPQGPAAPTTTPASAPAPAPSSTPTPPTAAATP